jgi:hypothetical protein
MTFYLQSGRAKIITKRSGAYSYIRAQAGAVRVVEFCVFVSSKPCSYNKKL